MRVPLSWLREYVDVQLSPEQLAERLTLLGMESRASSAGVPTGAPSSSASSSRSRSTHMPIASI